MQRFNPSYVPLNTAVMNHKFWNGGSIPPPHPTTPPPCNGYFESKRESIYDFHNFQMSTHYRYFKGHGATQPLVHFWLSLIPHGNVAMSGRRCIAEVAVSSNPKCHLDDAFSIRTWDLTGLTVTWVRLDLPYQVICFISSSYIRLTPTSY